MRRTWFLLCCSTPRRRLLSYPVVAAFALFFSLVAGHGSPASAATTVIGTVKDASGTVLASGTIIFTLSQEGTVTDPALLITPPVQCTITAGVILAPGGGACSLRGNDEISPADTFYRVRITSIGGRKLLPERRYTISGATWDIGTSTPLASDTVAATAYQIIQDEGTNLAQRAKLNFVGAGVSVADDSGTGVTEVTIPGGAGGAASTKEVPTGAINGINTVFDFTKTIDNTIFRLLWNGVMLEEGASDDYTITGATQITMALAPITGDKLFAYH